MAWLILHRNRRKTFSCRHRHLYRPETPPLPCQRSKAKSSMFGCARAVQSLVNRTPQDLRDEKERLIRTHQARLKVLLHIVAEYHNDLLIRTWSAASWSAALQGKKKHQSKSKCSQPIAMQCPQKLQLSKLLPLIRKF